MSPQIKHKKELSRYSYFRVEIASALAAIIQSATYDKEHIHHLLNGGASKALDEHISRKTRLKFGMFFSGQQLASSVADLIQHKIIQGAVLADPACGAGDLLLACLARAPLYTDLRSTLSAWGECTLGLDIHGELAGATRDRISLLAATRLFEEGRPLTSCFPAPCNFLTGIQSGNYLVQPELFANADCVVLNPPFTEIDAPARCGWTSGKVQQAAVFTEAVVRSAKTGQEVVAVLPDVLRSGTRYDRWRKMIMESADVLHVGVFGRFDPKTDVDVFVLHLCKRKANAVVGGLLKLPASAPGTNLTSPVLADFFKVSVGAVVPHRHNNKGQWNPYVDVKCAPANSEIRNFKNRRFHGTLHKGPFVAIRRTSSPSDAHRVVCSIINTKDYVAVENHLIVIQPHDGTLRSCRHLVAVLQKPHVTDWLNITIRCRHLTTRVISDLPIGDWK